MGRCLCVVCRVELRAALNFSRVEVSTRKRSAGPPHHASPHLAHLKSDPSFLLNVVTRGYW